MEIKPDYYDDFKCIAAECQHNCCIGWEIDVDDATLEIYKSQTGELKERLENNISLEPCAHFVLQGDERCPFLNDKNLCDLILHGGEEMLCEICHEHPRFYNDIYDVTEKGLGLCCEAAAKLILTKETPLKLISSSNEMPQNDFHKTRNDIFAILQNRKVPLGYRIEELLSLANTTSPINGTDWIEIYKSLERLDPKWDEYLNSAKNISEEIPENLKIPAEQLICYFIYRHLSGGLEDLRFCERVRFAVLSLYVIMSLNKSETVEEMLQIARMYSAEIEYSDENIDILLENL